MRELIMTGYGRKEAVKAKKIDCRCYLCKRKQSDKFMYAISDKDGYKYFGTKMGFQWVEIIKDELPYSSKGENTKFRFYLCEECMLLMEAMSEKFQLAKLMLTK